MSESTAGAILLGFVLIVLSAIVAGGCYAYPHYKVYQQEKAGEAQLREATFNRRIAVEEAQAELDSAELKSQADVIRAQGIAEANRIIGESITPAYIQWRWVEGLHDGTSEVIYVPTEANLPLLEATRGRAE